MPSISRRSLFFIFIAYAALLLPVAANATYVARMVIEDNGGGFISSGELTGDRTELSVGGNMAAIGYAPYVEARAVIPTAAVTSDLIYGVGVYGIANSFVPVSYNGFATATASAYGASQLLFALTYGNRTTDLQVYCYGAANRPPDSIPAGMPPYVLQDGASTLVQSCIGGDFFGGEIYVQLDSNGYRDISVELQARAFITPTPENGIRDDPPVLTFAFLDPHFEISSWFLNANPGYSLSVLDGFGNDTLANGNSVPEPGTLGLLLLALVLLCQIRRQPSVSVM